MNADKTKNFQNRSLGLCLSVFMPFICGQISFGFHWRRRFTCSWRRCFIINSRTVKARAPAEADIKAWQSQKHFELLRSALRNALKERCKLAIHEEPVGRNYNPPSRATRLPML